MATVYLAGPLFNAGERLHNLMLEQELRKLGHEVILPQREALKFIKDGVMDVAAVAADCAYQCRAYDVIFVGNADGPDADSGTCVELGLHAGSPGRSAILYRTDFRTAPEREVGVNAMLQLREVEFIYQPCFFTNLGEIGNYYRDLAVSIDHKIAEVVQRGTR